VLIIDQIPKNKNLICKFQDFKNLLIIKIITMNSEDLVASILNLSNLAKEKLKELEVVVNVDPSKKKKQ